MMLLAPWFLLGLLAIGLPLWLHRFSKQTQERQPFASLMLLEASDIRRSHRHTLKYLLLLALRIALLVALAFAFAELVLPWRTPPLDTSGRTLHVFVLDTSLSMRQGDRWARALEAARKLIDSMSPADQGMLVAADSRIRVVEKPVDASSAGQLRAALESVRPGMARLDYGMLMTSASSWIGSGPLRRRRLHLITDLQQSASPLRFADLEPPPGVALNIVDVSGGSTSNLSVRAVAPSAQDANILEARIRGTAEPGEQREVILTIDGEQRGRQPLRMESGETRVAFSGLDLGPGEHRVTVALAPQDSLAEDDTYYTVIERSERKALIVAADSSGNDAAYLEAAVGALTSPRLTVESVTAEALDKLTLADYSAIVVSDVGILSEQGAAAIGEYVQAGGVVLMTLGPRAASMRTLPVSGHRTSDSIAGSGGENPIRVADIESSHPALRDTQGWRSVRFFRYVPVETAPEDKVLIRFEQGHPLLIERSVLSGRLLVLTSPLDRDWNDLAIHPLFVRFIGEAVRYLTGASQTRVATVGSLLPAGVSGRKGAQVFDPQGRRVLPLGGTTGMARLAADQTGFYEVRGGGRSDWIAANVDPRESDLRRMSEDSIARWRSMQARAAAAQAQPPEAQAGEQMKPIWPWLLLLAVVLAFLESVVANWHLHVRRGVTT